MDRKTALTTTAALTLTIAGGVSALFLTIGQAEPEVATTPTSTIVTEYVDQFGNPVAAPSQAAAPTVLVVDGNGNPIEMPDAASTITAPEAPASYAEGDEPYEGAEPYEGEEYEGEEAEEYEEYEEEGEDHDEYEEEDDD